MTISSSMPFFMPRPPAVEQFTAPFQLFYPFQHLYHVNLASFGNIPAARIMSLHHMLYPSSVCHYCRQLLCGASRRRVSLLFLSLEMAIALSCLLSYTPTISFTLSSRLLCIASLPSAILLHTTFGQSLSAQAQQRGEEKRTVDSHQRRISSSSLHSSLLPLLGLFC
jgi:hypothetical protein